MNPCFISGKEIDFKVVAKKKVNKLTYLKSVRLTGCQFRNCIYAHVRGRRELRSLSMASGQMELEISNSCFLFSGMQEDCYDYPWN